MLTVERLAGLLEQEMLGKEVAIDARQYFFVMSQLTQLRLLGGPRGEELKLVDNLYSWRGIVLLACLGLPDDEIRLVEVRERVIGYA